MSVVSKTLGLKRENFALKSANQKQVLALTTLILALFAIFLLLNSTKWHVLGIVMCKMLVFIRFRKLLYVYIALLVLLYGMFQCTQAHHNVCKVWAMYALY